MGNVLLFYGGLVGALITLPITIFMFFKLNIKQVVEDLTGVRMTISKTDRKETTKEGTGRISKPITNEIKLRRDQANQEAAVASTELLHNEVESTSLIAHPEIEETTVLYEELEETTVLVDELEDTTFLQEEMEVTTLLQTDEDPDFKIELNIMVVHTETVI